MRFGKSITAFSTDHPRSIAAVMILVTIVIGAFITMIRVDTDPENMLSASEPVRVFHSQTKKTFSLSDMVVVGAVNETDPDGVFNPASLAAIYELTRFASTLQWVDPDDPNRIAGVVTGDILAPSTVDHIGQGGPGEVRFEYLMNKPPADRQQAIAIRDKALSNPLLRGTLVSEDGKAVCLYIPLTSKDVAYRVYSALKEKTDSFSGDDRFYITGLPVAEDTFGVEMFRQMAISAPMAMAVVFILMMLFFRKLVLVLAPMIIAVCSIAITMGLLIGTGHPVHIMSSMIPIFLMPISVVDSIHIISEFFEQYKSGGRRSLVIQEVMKTLFVPMLYTSLTSAAGFASLALTPIPPVQVFGVFVAIGIMIAWFLTITFIPAYVMMLKDSSLAGFGRKPDSNNRQTQGLLKKIGLLTGRRAKPILAVTALALAVAAYGTTLININDNPVKWFSKSHPIRVADIKLNSHFGGTYVAYLVLDGAEGQGLSEDYIQALRSRLGATAARLVDIPGVGDVFTTAGNKIADMAAYSATKTGLLGKLKDLAEKGFDQAGEDRMDAWDELAAFFDLEAERLKAFKRPDVLRYIANIQRHLAHTGLVGKSNSVADIVAKVYQELTGGAPENYIIPQSLPAVSECLMQFQNSHNPDDLWHMVTPDHSAANIWLQLKSGDNRDMTAVAESIAVFMAENTPPVPIEHHWAGLTYINVIWQKKMVMGMLQSFLGSFLVVFVMMAILFRSALWGAVCMVPLAVTIAIIYGIIGLVGKDYDMPVAVLSALTLGMAVDFAIHFLERSRASYATTGSWPEACGKMFGEPARAISRNVMVIAIGFLPLLAAPLVPYKTVGVLLCAIMALSGLVTLLVLPSILTILEKRLFAAAAQPLSVGCNCAFCLAVSTAIVLLVAVNIHQFALVGFSTLAWISAAIIPIMAITCGIMSRRRTCRAAGKLPVPEAGGK